MKNHQIMEQFNEIIKQIKELDKENSSFMNLDEAELAYIYNLGVKFVSIGDYEHAIKLFQFLLIYNPFNIDYLKALAGSLHAIKDYENAYSAYFTAYDLDKENQKDCLFYLGACSFYLKKTETSIEYLKEFLISSQDKKMNARAKLFIKQIESDNKKEQVKDE